MKKVILIGKFNETTKEINESLSSFCQVQLCSDSVDIARGMLRLVKPDIVIVSLVGSSSVNEDIFTLLFRDCRETPILATGSQTVEEELMASGFLEGGRVQFLKRTLGVEGIANRVRQLVGEPVPPSHTQKKTLPVQEGKKTILVVDDNPTFLRSMQSMLTPAYRVVFATSGPQAIAVIAKGRPDLILLDYEMPVVNGKMTLQMLRSEENTKDIPVVFLTGMAESENVQELVSLLPNGYLLKPPSEDRLYDTIEGILGPRH